MKFSNANKQAYLYNVGLHVVPAYYEYKAKHVSRNLK